MDLRISTSRSLYSPGSTKINTAPGRTSHSCWAFTSPGLLLDGEAHRKATTLKRKVATVERPAKPRHLDSVLPRPRWPLFWNRSPVGQEVYEVRSHYLQCKSKKLLYQLYSGMPFWHMCFAYEGSAKLFRNNSLTLRLLSLPVLPLEESCSCLKARQIWEGSGMCRSHGPWSW